MLRILQRIVQEVSSAEDLLQALDIFVHRVREAVHTQASAIYLTDNRSAEYVLLATDGLNREALRKIRVPFDKGLIGLVGRREEPINLENAAIHPDFFYHAELGEEKFKAFLGVPVIHHRRLYGVLTIQQEEARCFDESEEAFLVTLAAQLGGVIAHAEATGELVQLTALSLDEGFSEDAAIGGLPSGPGVGIGIAIVVYPPADLDSVPDEPTSHFKKEIALLKAGLEETREEIERLRDRLSTTLRPGDRALFDVYLKILSSNSLEAEVIAVIREEKIWAQAALGRVIRRHVLQFESMDDEYLKERASDFRDLGRRVLAHLQAIKPKVIDYPKNTILVGEDVTAAALAEVPEGCLKGIISIEGSHNSHVAILARSLGIPTVMGAQGMSLKHIASKLLIVDGYFGQVYVAPSERLLAEFKKIAQEEEALNEELDTLHGKDTQTTDGYRLALYVNMGLPQDAALSLSVAAEGVGLYRSEVPFMMRDRFPSEEEQRIIYHQLLKAFAPRWVTMRTLDVGGDKALPYLPVSEENPFLGWRGIRVTLDHPDVFLMQVRAMLQASRGLNNLRILLPMISGVGELDEALRLIDQAYREVLEEGGRLKKPQIGVMIEVPSAVYQARDIARRVDFLSVGSNDLTQYLLAVDRSNARVAGLYDSLHPAVLKSLMQAVDGGHNEGIHVSICGEMASDPAAVIVLLAMGFDSLSINSNSLLRVKWVICNFSMASARKVLSEVLEMDNPTLIRFHLERALVAAGLGNLIRVGKT